MKSLKIVFLLAFVATQAWSAGREPVRGISLTETWKYAASDVHVVDLYDAAEAGQPKTPAQKVVDRLFDLGFRRINLSPQGHMRDPKQSQFVANVQGPERRKEKTRMKRLIAYIASKGMTVGIRPIFFVLSKDGRPGLEETINGKPFLWWHGNIQPKDPNAWFESYRTFLRGYYDLAAEKGVEEFTIGAELYSMTVGIEDQWKEHPHGFPGEWLKTLREAKKAVPAHVWVMYDINFTDERTDAGDLSQFGGEFARWYYRLAEFEKPDPSLVAFWNELDAIGVDMYRSLVSDDDAKKLPRDRDALVQILRRKSDLFAEQIDQNLEKIGTKLGTGFKNVILKEIGYASRDLAFLRPFEYASANTAPRNAEHQAAAYEAIFRSFAGPGFEWFKGIVFWDASVNERLHGAEDNGFSPIGKPPTEAVLRLFWSAK